MHVCPAHVPLQGVRDEEDSPLLSRSLWVSGDGNDKVRQSEMAADPKRGKVPQDTQLLRQPGIDPGFLAPRWMFQDALI